MSVSDLHYSFGLRRVLKGMSLAVEAGETVAIFAQNGAGKTTLLRVIAGLLRTSRGSIRVRGFDLRLDSVEVRRRVGFASHQGCLYPELSAVENLRLFGQLYRIDGLDEHVRELLQTVGLYSRRDDRVQTFSRGMRQRLELARAVLHDPDLLLLDEPDTGLDPQALRILQTLTQETTAAGRGVLFTTHDLRLGLELADRVCVLAKGRLVLDEDTALHSEASLRCRYEALVEEVR